MRYIHPLRLYLIITFLFFLALSYLMMAQLEDASFQSTVRQQISELTKSDTLATTEVKEQPAKGLPSPPFELNGDQGLGFKRAYLLMADVQLSDEMVMDSLKVSEANKKNEDFLLFFHQGRRVVQKDLDVFIPYVLKNLPVMMFLLLPVFALYLMSLFHNRPNLYIQHLIHSLHVHSMAFLLLTVFILVGWLFGHYFFWTTFLLITLYALLSVKKVYQQPWGRTGWKFLLLGMFYFCSLFTFVVVEVTISFLTF